MNAVPVEYVEQILDEVNTKHIEQLKRMSDASKRMLNEYAQASDKIRHDAIFTAYRLGLFYGIGTGIVLGVVIALIATRLFA